MKRLLVPVFAAFLAIAMTIAAASGAPAQVLFAAGEPSHGPGEHRFPEGCALLAAALQASGLAVQTEVAAGWPDAAALARADTLVIYSDGLERHVAAGHVEDLRRHLEARRGLVVLHFALEPATGELADLWLEHLGARFEAGWSVNPVWTATDVMLAAHEVTRGVEPFTLDDEWYYHLRFRPGTVPVVQALPPATSLGADGPRSGNPMVRAALARGETQALAWVLERDGARAFGCTGGHFHRNWAHDEFRQLVLNAIVWSAGVAVPADGVASIVPPLPRYATIDEAIARGDLEDTRRHLAADPAAVHRGANPALTPLQQAILRNQTAIAEVLLTAGADPNLADGSARTPLHLAVVRGNPAIIDLLLARRADPNRRDRIGWTPLHHAGARDQVGIARALLDGGADPALLSELGGTPLHEAAASGGAAMVELLLARGVDPAVVSQMGVTALDVAQEAKNQPAIDALSGR